MTCKSLVHGMIWKILKFGLKLVKELETSQDSEVNLI